MVEISKIQFKNFKEIEKYYKNQFVKGNLKSIKNSTGKKKFLITDDILKKEAEELRMYIQNHIDGFYSLIHKSKGGLKSALTVGTIINDTKNGKRIGLYFEESKSWGQSVVTDEWNGWKPVLTNFGYKHSSGGAEYKKPHFLGYEGYHFVEKGIEDWKRESKYSEYISIKYLDELGYNIEGNYIYD